MARPHPLQPDPGPDGLWSSCDDQQPGVSIRPLSQAELAALLAYLDHDQDQDRILRVGGPAPVVAVRVRASVGRPGASAAAEYRRRRAASKRPKALSRRCARSLWRCWPRPTCLLCLKRRNR